MTEEQDTLIRGMAKELGSRGGIKTRDTREDKSEYYRELQKKSVLAKLAKKKNS
ncbi:MAG: hypothetical protein HY865_22465 [Chloroflexi bacterium]|nr:hypothetical protein [Chloroflexota bacterium]